MKSGIEKLSNIFRDIPDHGTEEICETLLERGNFRLERIVSRGQATPPGQWLDQEREEWVILLSGGAGLRFEGETAGRDLQPGDHLVIPAHRRHRVEWTGPDKTTVWLALHYVEEV